MARKSKDADPGVLAEGMKLLLSRIADGRILDGSTYTEASGTMPRRYDRRNFAIVLNSARSMGFIRIEKIKTSSRPRRIIRFESPANEIRSRYESSLKIESETLREILEEVEENCTL